MSKPEIKVEVGMHGTYSIGSDAYPVTVIEVYRNFREIVVQYDNFVADKEKKHDYFGQQHWKIIRNEKGRTEIFTWKRKYKRFGPKSESSGTLHLGTWNAKQDPSF